MGEREADRVLDLRGWSCPWCILKAKSWLKRMKAGQVLEVLSTDPNVLKNFPLVLDRTNDRVISMDQDPDFFRVRVRRGCEDDAPSNIATVSEATYRSLGCKEKIKNENEREDCHGRS